MKDGFNKIHKAALKFLVPLNPQDTYRLIVEEARKLVKAEYGSILLDHHGELLKVYTYPDILYQVQNRRRGFMSQVFYSKTPLIVDIDEYAHAHPLVKQMKVKTSIGTPLMYKGKAMGVLTLHSVKKNAFGESDISILKLFGSMATLAIRKTQLYDESKKALETRDRFIAMASHELRTPLTTINGYIQLLHYKLAKNPGVESKWMEELSWENNRLIQLVNELLAVDQIKTGKFKYFWKECSLVEVINRAVISFKFAHPEHEIVFLNRLGNKPGLVVGDFDKLLQVVTNLLDNSAKFSPFKSVVTVSLDYRQPQLILTIKDQSHGISKKDLPKIFDRYYKGQDHSREGMGLGLYLVKNIIAEHRGKVTIASKKDSGVTVKVLLPGVKHG